jgi:hypothetical protein
MQRTCSTCVSIVGGAVGACREPAAPVFRLLVARLVHAENLQHLCFDCWWRGWCRSEAAAPVFHTLVAQLLGACGIAGAPVLGRCLRHCCCTCSRSVPAALLLHLFSVGACSIAAASVLGFMPTVKLHCRACWWVRSMRYHACSILQACHPSPYVLCMHIPLAPASASMVRDQ